MDKFSLAKKLKNLKRKVEIEVPDLTEEELNLLPEKDNDLFPGYVYDPSEDFRTEVLNNGFFIKKLIAVYYQGWECDEWACIAEKNGKSFYLSSSHGSIIEKAI